MRRGIEKLIDIDREIGTVVRIATVDNGRGVSIPDGEFKEHKIICRVGYQSGGVWGARQIDSGLTIDKTPFILARFDTDLNKDDTLTWRGRKYTVGVVSRPEEFGGAICTQAPLVEVKSGS